MFYTGRNPISLLLDLNALQMRENKMNVYYSFLLGVAVELKGWKRYALPGIRKPMGEEPNVSGNFALGYVISVYTTNIGFFMFNAAKYHTSSGSSGLSKDHRENDFHVNQKRIYRLMRILGLKSINHRNRKNHIK